MFTALLNPLFLYEGLLILVECFKMFVKQQAYYNCIMNHVPILRFSDRDIGI